MANARKDSKGRALRKGETQKKDGSYVYTYTDSFRDRKYIYAKDLTKLREREQQLQKDQLDGIDLYQAGTVTLDAMFDRYLSLKDELRDSTRVSYKRTYDVYVRKGFGKRLISDIRYSDVKIFYNHLMKEKSLQANTLNNVHGILHPTFQLAVRDGIIRNNPSDGLMGEILRKSGTKSSTRHAMTLEQQRAFLKFVADSFEYRRWLTMFTFMLGTGCRIGETVGLRWADIDFENRNVSINHSLRYYADGEGDDRMCTLHWTPPKTIAGERDIPMLNEVYDALKDEYEAQKVKGFCKSEIDGNSGFVFFNRWGNIHIPTTVDRALYSICDDYNAQERKAAAKERRKPVLLPKISCHILRHTFCTRLCENETNLKAIQSIMGHADIKVTMNIYAEATADKKKEAMESLSHNLSLF